MTASLLAVTVPQLVITFIVVTLLLILVGVVVVFASLYKRVEQGTAIVVNGVGGTKVSFTGMPVFPVIQRAEPMDISVKRIEIYRHGTEGLICMDNIRADIKVAFFVRVNKTVQDVLQVAQLLGCKRASQQAALEDLFDAKFSEALKTVGKQFHFVDLYNSRDRFKDEILKTIGTDLNGYVLDDAAIDYLEQTPLEKMNPENILDAEGIKKITDLTAQQHVLSNHIRREREKTITKQDVEAREAVLELQRQQAEAEERQRREIAEVESRQRAEAAIVAEQQRLRAAQARIATEEEIQIAEENKNRQILVAQKNKARTDAVETERVEKDRMLEATERERVVALATIEKEKAVEHERKNIQDVIRDRVIVERAVVEEEERIKDTREYAAAARLKQVAITEAEMLGEQKKVQEVKAAESAKVAAELHAQERVIAADAYRTAAERQTEGKKMLAEAAAAEAASAGLAEARVLEARAAALEKQGRVEAQVLQAKAVAEAEGVSAMADAARRQGETEAHVIELKFKADADGITQKAEAMKLLDGVGRDHEEFKLRLTKDKEIELAAIEAQKDIAAQQANVLAAALKSAHIDIVGGDHNFFDKVVSAVSQGKTVDRLVHNSQVLTDLQRTFFNGDPDYFANKLRTLSSHFNLQAEDVRDLSIAALITRMMTQAQDGPLRQELQQLMNWAHQTGLATTGAETLQLFAATNGKSTS